MKKIIIGIILGIVLLLNISAMSGGCYGDGEKTIKVYGTVELDGEPLEDAQITVKNLDRGYEESTDTDNDGYYEVYVNGKNNDEIKIEVEFNDIEDDREFEIQDGKNQYEINFEFESTPVRKTYHKVLNLIIGCTWGFWEWLICIFLILLCLCMVKKIFFAYPYNNNNNNNYRKR